MWAEFEADRKQFTSSLLTFPPFSVQCKCWTVVPQVNQMDEQNVWPCHLLTPTHTLTRGVGGAAAGGGVMAQSLWSFRSVRPSSRYPGWIIYNHFLPGSSGWWDSWPLNSLNLIMCHWRNHSRTFTQPPHVSHVTARTIWQTSLGRRATMRWRPIQRAKVPCFLSVSDFVARCIKETDSRFMCSGQWFPAVSIHDICSLVTWCNNLKLGVAG